MYVAKIDFNSPTPAVGFFHCLSEGIPSMSHQWVTIQAITPNQDRLARMAQLRRERNQRGGTTPYRHGTDRETGKHVIQALKRKEAAHDAEAHAETSGLRPGIPARLECHASSDPSRLQPKNGIIHRT